MQYILIAKLKAGAGPGRLAHHLLVYVADPSAFGLCGSRPADEYPAAHVQTPRMLDYAAKVDRLLAEARSFQACRRSSPAHRPITLVPPPE